MAVLKILPDVNRCCFCYGLKRGSILISLLTIILAAYTGYWGASVSAECSEAIKQYHPEVIFTFLGKCKYVCAVFLCFAAVLLLIGILIEKRFMAKFYIYMGLFSVLVDILITVALLLFMLTKNQCSGSFYSLLPSLALPASANSKIFETMVVFKFLPTRNDCCFCVELKYGALITAILTIVSGVSTFQTARTVPLVCINKTSLNHYIDFLKMTNFELIESTKYVMGLFLIYVGIKTLIAVLKTRARYMKRFICYGTLTLLLDLSITTTLVVYMARHDVCRSSIYQLASVYFLPGPFFYCIVIINSYEDFMIDTDPAIDIIEKLEKQKKKKPFS